MSPTWARLIRMLVSALVSGAMGVGSNLLTAMQASGDIPKGAMVVALITGGLLVLKDIQAYLATSPVENKPS